MESFEAAEFRLQQQLKQLCDAKGRETDPHESAVIFNELGLLYKTKSPDKISLIRSSALLNAAIVRQPNNQKFQHDLHQLCKHVLKCAKAKLNDANLVDSSKSVAKRVEEMRKNVKSRLKAIKKIPDDADETTRLSMEADYCVKVKSLQKRIAVDYKGIMTSVSRQCIEIMGRPPSTYALVGMGSLAREEITPYSDFEHVLVLKNLVKKRKQNIKRIKGYFRWYSVLFHITVINLRETDLYSVCIPCLNDHSKPDGNWFYDKVTTQGISFDGMMPHACHFPLGKTEKTETMPWTTELIKTVDEMVNLLEVKDDLKSGYKLGDLLTRTCFVEGDETIYQQFFYKIAQSLKRNLTTHQCNVKKQLQMDLKNFDLSDNLWMFSVTKHVNIKNVIYRSISLFILALGRLHGSNLNSGFDIIENLFEKNLITKYVTNRLLFAMATACHIRSFQYMSKNRQDDSVWEENAVFGSEKVKKLTQIISKDCLLLSMSTAYALQTLLNGNDELGILELLLRLGYVSYRLQFLNLLGLHHEAIKYGEKSLKTPEVFMFRNVIENVLSEIGFACNRTGQHHKFLAVLNTFEPHIDDQFSGQAKSKFYKSVVVNKLSCLAQIDSEEELSAVIKETDALLNFTENNIELAYRKYDLYRLSGFCKQKLQKHREALSSFREYFKDFKISKHWCKDVSQACVMINVVISLSALRRNNQALHLTWEGLNYLDMIGAALRFYELFFTVINSLAIPLVPEENLKRDQTFHPPMIYPVDVKKGGYYFYDREDEQSVLRYKLLKLGREMGIIALKN